MKNLLCSVLMIALSAITNIKSLHEIHFDRIELVNRTEFPGIYKVDKLRVKKFNRTAFVIDADFEIIQDIDERFSAQVDFYASRKGNTQYNKSPIKIDRQTVCSILEKFYKNGFAIMEELKHTSNLPQYAPDDVTCPFKKGRYYVRDYLFKQKNLPKWMPEAAWRIDFFVFMDEECIAYIKLYAILQSTRHHR